MKAAFRPNSFDIVRLVAALQVALDHGAFHLEVTLSPWIHSITDLLPGVPIFFFVSGFLISKSYESNSNPREYAQNRALRIYPALIACTLASLISVGLTGYFSRPDVTWTRIAGLFAGQTTIFQFYNPAFMRAFGTGVLNGSLWTITVELQFYLLVPFLYHVLDRVDPRRKNMALLALILLFATVNWVFSWVRGQHEDGTIVKLWGVSFLPWFYMFLVGVFFQVNFAVFHRVLTKKLLFVLPFSLYAALAEGFHWQLGNQIGPALYLLLATTVFSFAYSFPNLSRKTLAGNDLSYGVYIYHIPIINVFLYLGYKAEVQTLLLALALTIVAAALSWALVERPSLKLKAHPLNPLRT